LIFIIYICFSAITAFFADYLIPRIIIGLARIFSVNSTLKYCSRHTL